MVVLASVKVDLRNLTLNEAKRILTDKGFKTKEKMYDEHIVYFCQMNVDDLTNDGYVLDSDNKLMDHVHLRLYKNEDRAGTEVSKKDLINMYRDGVKMTSKVSPRRTVKKTSPRRTTKSTSKPAAKKTSPKKTKKATIKKTEYDDDGEYGDDYY